MEFTIEKWIYGGEGLGRMAPDETGRGKAVFIPFTLPAETVEAEVTEERSGFARASLTRVITGSEARVAPRCPYFGACGGCQYQHADYKRQVELKRDILLETLQRTAKIKLECDVQLHAAEPYQFRNRTRLKVRPAPDFAVGYHRFGTNELLPVRECPISSPLIQRTIAALWDAGTREVSTRGLREVQLFANHDDSALLVELYTERDTAPDSLRHFIEAIREIVPEIAGATVFTSLPESEDERPPLTVAKFGGGAQSFGAEFLEYRTKHGEFRVSAGSFFQTNRFLVDRLAEVALEEASGRTALDLYAGAGLFSVPLAHRFDRVVAVEASPFSFKDLQHNAPENLKPVHSTTEKYLQNIGRKSGLDLVVLDPPRAGMGERTAKLLAQAQPPRIAYVSCDPATLARDARVLAAAGYGIASAHLVDMFPQTAHMETVLHFSRH